MLHPECAGASRGQHGDAAAAACAHVHWLKLMTHSPFLHNALLDKYMDTSNLTDVHGGIPLHVIEEDGLGLDEDTDAEKDTRHEETMRRRSQLSDSTKLNKYKDTNDEKQLNSGIMARASDDSIINLTKLFSYSFIEPHELNQAEKKGKYKVVENTKSISKCRLSRSKKIYAYDLSGDNDDFAAAGDNVKLPEVNLFDYNKNHNCEWKSRNSSIMRSMYLNEQGNYVTIEKETDTEKSIVETEIAKGSTEKCEFQLSGSKSDSLGRDSKIFKLYSFLPSRFIEFSKDLARKTMSIFTSFSKCSDLEIEVNPRNNLKEIIQVKEIDKLKRKLTAPLDQQRKIEEATLYANLPQTKNVNLIVRDSFSNTDNCFGILKADKDSIINFIKDNLEECASSTENKGPQDQILSTQDKKLDDCISNVITDIVLNYEEIKKITNKSANVRPNNAVNNIATKTESGHDIVSKDSVISSSDEIKYSVDYLNEIDSSSATRTNIENEIKHDEDIQVRSFEKSSAKDPSLESIYDISSHKNVTIQNEKFNSTSKDEDIVCLKNYESDEHQTYYESGSMNNMLLHDLPDIDCMHKQLTEKQVIRQPKSKDSIFNITHVISESSHPTTRSFETNVNRISKNIERLPSINDFMRDKSSITKFKSYKEIDDIKPFEILASEKASKSHKLPSNEHFLWEYCCDSIWSTETSQLDFVSNKSNRNIQQHNSPSLLSCKGPGAEMAYNLEEFIKSKYEKNESQFKPESESDPRLVDSRQTQSKYEAGKTKRAYNQTYLSHQTNNNYNKIALDQSHYPETQKKTATNRHFRPVNVFNKPLDTSTRDHTSNGFGRVARSERLSREENDLTLNKVKSSNTVTLLNCDAKLFNASPSWSKFPYQHRKKAYLSHKKLPEVRCEYCLPYDSDESAAYYNSCANDVNRENLVSKNFDRSVLNDRKTKKRVSREPFPYDNFPHLEIPTLYGTTKRSRFRNKCYQQGENALDENYDLAAWEEVTSQFKAFEKYIRAKHLKRQARILADSMKESCHLLANERRRLVSTYRRTNEDIYWSESD